MTPLSEMAREIERRKPGCLPESIVLDDCIRALDESGRYSRVHDDIASAVLRDAIRRALPYYDFYGNKDLDYLFERFLEAFPEPTK